MDLQNEYRSKDFPIGRNGPGNDRFQELYFALRNSEKRIYSDEEVLNLPEVNENNIYKNEWKIRKDSCKRLTSYLDKKNRFLKILEIGCGNGWLSSRLAKIRQTEVTGLDINLLELNQAARVFSHQVNLQFIYGDIRSAFFEQGKFDQIIFAASIQYFPLLSEIIHKALKLLDKDGEIHILDSAIYHAIDLSRAKQKSRTYFRQIGFEDMTELYFHHSWKSLEEFNHDVLYDPASIRNKILMKKNPFYWIRIKGKE